MVKYPKYANYPFLIIAAGQVIFLNVLLGVDLNYCFVFVCFFAERYAGCEPDYERLGQHGA